MRRLIRSVTVIAAVLIASAPALAQSDGSEAKEASKADKSGTNPINFTNDLRAYYEYQNLSGGGTGHVGTLEGRTPILDGKLQVRVRVPFKAVNFDVGGINFSESGLGEINARLLAVPFLDPKNGVALATGLEMFFPTAGDDLLGDGKFSLGPQIFGVKFAPFGIKGSLIAPAVQQVFSVAGDSDRKAVNKTQLDLFILKLSDDKKTYVLLDPQYVIDWENDKQFGLFEAEAGYVFDSGISLYGRPGVGFGGDKPIDFNFEVGIKYIF